jgi:hypothetical protein
MYLFVVIILNGVVKNSTTEINTKLLAAKSQRLFHISTRMTVGFINASCYIGFAVEHHQCKTTLVSRRNYFRLRKMGELPLTAVCLKTRFVDRI